MVLSIKTLIVGVKSRIHIVVKIVDVPILRQVSVWTKALFRRWPSASSIR